MKAKQTQSAGRAGDDGQSVDVLEHPRLRARLPLQRILVPIDFSECSLLALDYAQALALRFDARLIVLHVVEPAMQPADNYLSLTGGLDQRNELFLQTARERLEALTRRKLPASVGAEPLVRMGHAYSEIPDTAKAMGADLIIVAAHECTGSNQVLLGSTAEWVVRHAPCPVLTIPHPQ